MTDLIEPGFVRQAHCINDECISLPLSNRISHPCWIDILGMLSSVGIDMEHEVVILEKDDHLVRELYDLHGKRNQKNPRHTGRQTIRDRVLRKRACVWPVPWLDTLEFRLCPCLQGSIVWGERIRILSSRPNSREIGRMGHSSAARRGRLGGGLREAKGRAREDRPYGKARTQNAISERTHLCTPALDSTCDADPENSGLFYSTMRRQKDYPTSRYLAKVRPAVNMRSQSGRGTYALCSQRRIPSPSSKRGQVQAPSKLICSFSYPCSRAHRSRGSVASSSTTGTASPVFVRSMLLRYVWHVSQTSTRTCAISGAE
jgi:hypothetical protein